MLCIWQQFSGISLIQWYVLGIECEFWNLKVLREEGGGIRMECVIIKYTNN